MKYTFQQVIADAIIVYSYMGTHGVSEAEAVTRCNSLLHLGALRPLSKDKYLVLSPLCEYDIIRAPQFDESCSACPLPYDPANPENQGVRCRCGNMPLVKAVGFRDARKEAGWEMVRLLNTILEDYVL